jgi:outer membrane autotransporter protein
VDFAKKFRLTVNQRAVAGALDKVAFRNSPGKLIRFLDCQPLEKLPADFDRIAPEELTSIFNIGMALANVQGVNLQRRTADLRAGASGFSAAGLAMQGSGPNYAGPIQFRTGAAGPTGNEGKDSKVVDNPLPDNRWGVFLTGTGEWVDVKGDGNARGYNLDTGGFTLGVDYKITPSFAVGLSAGYAGTGSDLANNGRVFVNGGKVGLYSTYFTGGFYVDTAVSGGYNSYDTRRSALQGDARGSTDGGELDLLVGTGYDWKIGALSLGPTANFQYTYVGLDGFTEHGSLAPLRFGTQNGESSRTAFGFKTSYDWKAGGVVIRPELRAAWQHEYGDAGYALDSSLASGAGNLFTVNGPETGRDSLLLGAGFAILWNERTSTYVYYDGELFRTRYNSQSVSGGVRVAF